MRVLVTAASRHGATNEVGAAIAGTISGYGIDVEFVRPAEISAIDAFDAIVLGSAVYIGRWLPEARDFTRRFATDLTKRPVWLFSSGPIGDPPRPAEEPVDLGELTSRLSPRGHTIFPGAVERRRLSRSERFVMRAFRAPEGDFRPWDDIRSWAATIAHELHAGVDRGVRP